MKVLLLSPIPPPVGGIASWSLNIIEHYENNKDVLLVHQNTAIKFRRITKKNFFSRIMSGTIDGFGIVRNFIAFLRKEKPDVIHITSSGSLGLFRDLLVVLIAKSYRVPLVIHLHYGRIAEIRKLANWEWKLLHLVVYLSKHTIVLDAISRVALENADIHNVSVIPNPVSSRVEAALWDCAGTGLVKVDRGVRVVFVGHVIKDKGVFDLVEACVLAKVVDDLVFVGPFERHIKEELLNVALHSGVKMKFLGVLNSEAVYSEMKSATMLALPSYSEGFPNVIIEAMAMKCPVVATNVGAIPSMLEPGSSVPAGLMVQPGDVEGLRNAIEIIATDKSKVEEIKINAFAKVKNEYTLKEICARYEEVWRRSL